MRLTISRRTSSPPNGGIEGAALTLIFVNGPYNLFVNFSLADCADGADYSFSPLLFPFISTTFAQGVHEVSLLIQCHLTRTPRVHLVLYSWERENHPLPPFDLRPLTETWFLLPAH